LVNNNYNKLKQEKYHSILESN